VPFQLTPIWGSLGPDGLSVQLSQERTNFMGQNVASVHFRIGCSWTVLARSDFRTYCHQLNPLAFTALWWHMEPQMLVSEGSVEAEV